MRPLTPALMLFAALAWPAATQALPERQYQVSPQPGTVGAPRLGLNLGEWVSWGAAQFPANVLKNPGFEGVIDRAIVIVKAADNFGFSDDSPWTKRPDGFWVGAGYDVRSGADAGKQGTVFDSKAAGKLGLPSFSVLGKTPGLQPGDVLSLTLTNDKALPGQWWFSDKARPGELAASGDIRPNSPGSRSLALRPGTGRPVEVSSYLDTIGGRAGKLLPVNGPWVLRFWLKQRGEGSALKTTFRRVNGGQPFFEATFRPTREWQQIERRFDARDEGPPGPLSLTFSAEGGGGEIMLDDAELMAASAGAFRQELVDTLKILQPGYLRDWQGQLGDTFGNRTAEPFARRSSRYRPGDSATFGYGLDEFLQLAQDVGSQPWLIVPPTLGDDELEKLGAYLRRRLDGAGFKEILVEFGNENWNPVFRHAGIPDYKSHGAAATRAFRRLLAGAGNPSGIRTVVNGQYVNPWLSAKFLEHSPAADLLAVAPYFLFTLNAGDDILASLFKQDDFYTETLAAAKAQGKSLAVYEVNLHTTGGDAPATARDSATTSAAAGAALAKRLLTGLNLGITRQCLYTLAQYDAFMDSQGQRSLVKLWGVARDVAAAPRLRPTGLAMAMLNQALPADVHPVASIGENDGDITLAALHAPAGWALAAVSAKAETQKVTVQFPGLAGPHAWRLLSLQSPSPLDGNEGQAAVRIAEEQAVFENGAVSLALPPYGLMVAVMAK